VPNESLVPSILSTKTKTPQEAVFCSSLSDYNKPKGIKGLQIVQF